MKNTTISTPEELKARIAVLNAEIAAHELNLKANLKELHDALSPAALIKKTLHDIAGDKETRSDMTTIGVNAGSEFLISKLLGTNTSLKGYLTSALFHKLGVPLLMHAPKIIAGIGNFIRKRKIKKEEQRYIDGANRDE